MHACQYAAFFVLSAISAAAIAVGLATQEWVTYETSVTTVLTGTTTGHVYYGIKNYWTQVDDGDRSKHDYDCNENTSAGQRDCDFIKAGNVALGLGVVALACLALNFIIILLLKMIQTWTGGKGRAVAIIFSSFAAALVIAGAISYSQTMPALNDTDPESKYGWSFGLYIAGGALNAFVVLALCCAAF